MCLFMVNLFSITVPTVSMKIWHIFANRKTYFDFLALFFHFSSLFVEEVQRKQMHRCIQFPHELVNILFNSYLIQMLGEHRWKWRKCMFSSIFIIFFRMHESAGMHFLENFNLPENTKRYSISLMCFARKQPFHMNMETLDLCNGLLLKGSKFKKRKKK